jgi:hypothetical protein
VALISTFRRDGPTVFPPVALHSVAPKQGPHTLQGGGLLFFLGIWLIVQIWSNPLAGVFPGTYLGIFCQLENFDRAKNLFLEHPAETWIGVPLQSLGSRVGLIMDLLGKFTDF